MAYSIHDRNYEWGKKFTMNSLQSYVDQYNAFLCKDKSNHLEISRYSNVERPHAGYVIYLTGNVNGDNVSGVGRSKIPFIDSEGSAHYAGEKLIRSARDGSLKKFIESYENPY